MTTSNYLVQASGERGFALLVAVLIASVVLAVGLSIANITLKQLVFAGLGEQSEIAFNAADVGMECALFWDTSIAGASRGGDGKGQFALGNDDIGNANERSIRCMAALTPTLGGDGDSVIESGEHSTAEFTWGSDPVVCTKIDVVKYYDAANLEDIPDTNNDCPAGAVCTIVESRGYNRACSVVDNIANPDPRVVERALRARY